MANNAENENHNLRSPTNPINQRKGLQPHLLDLPYKLECTDQPDGQRMDPDGLKTEVGFAEIAAGKSKCEKDDLEGKQEHGRP